MIFAFDFDGMLTACPDLWVPTIKLAQTQGHRVVIATGRPNRDGGDQNDLEEFCSLHKIEGVDFFFCGSVPKRKYLEAAGVLVAAWVDDNPAMVDFGYDGLDQVGEFNGAQRR